MTAADDVLASTPSRHPAVETAQVLDRVVLFDDRDAGVHELNESATLVWLAVDGQSSVRTIADRLGKRLGQRVTDDVAMTVEELARLGLLTDVGSPAGGPVAPHGDPA